MSKVTFWLAGRRGGWDATKRNWFLAAWTFVERIANELSFVASSVSLVGARNDFPSLKNIPDVHEHWGALGGIHAALTAAETDWVVVVACDLPFVTTQLFAHLKNYADDTLDAVVPIQADGRPQPVCALYRRGTCLPEIDKLVAAWRTHSTGAAGECPNPVCRVRGTLRFARR
jgi:molybdopterin-guanine dinucleotide biosynthesis protein A